MACPGMILNGTTDSLEGPEDLLHRIKQIIKFIETNGSQVSDSQGGRYKKLRLE